MPLRLTQRRRVIVAPVMTLPSPRAAKALGSEAGARPADSPVPVPVLQWDWELDWLRALYESRQPKTVLEIGTYQGGTLWGWLRWATWAVTVVAIEDFRAIPRTAADRWPQWQQPWTRFRLIDTPSTEARTIEAAKEHAPYDWLFIDGDHREPQVEAEWNVYGPLVATGGMVIFHDIVSLNPEPGIEVHRVWRRIQAQGFLTQEIIADPAQSSGGLGCVFL